MQTDDAFGVSDTVAWEVSGEMFTAWLEGGEIPVVLPWTPVNSNVELRDGQLVAGFGRWAEFRVYSLEGGPQQSVRWNPAPDPVDSAGVWLGPVNLPAGFAAHEVANDHVYGVHTTPLGAQTFRVYRLVRGA